jgi:hypothetical protein
VTLSGTARLVTRIDILLGSNISDATVDVQIKIFSNGGVSGAPGTLLWASAVFYNLNLVAGQTMIGATPNVAVPDTLTWAVELSDWPESQIDVIGPISYDSQLCRNLWRLLILLQQQHTCRGESYPRRTGCSGFWG